MQCPQEDRERWKVYDNGGPEYEEAGGLSESEAMIFDGIYRRTKEKFYRFGL